MSTAFTRDMLIGSSLGTVVCVVAGMATPLGMAMFGFFLCIHLYALFTEKK